MALFLNINMCLRIIRHLRNAFNRKKYSENKLEKNLEQIVLIQKKKFNKIIKPLSISERVEKIRTTLQY